MSAIVAIEQVETPKDILSHGCAMRAPFGFARPRQEPHWFASGTAQTASDFFERSIAMIQPTPEGQADLNAHIKKEMPDIQRVARKVARLLNSLSPEGAVYTHTMLGADLIASVMEDGDMAVGLSKHLQGEIEKALRMNPKYAGKVE